MDTLYYMNSNSPQTERTTHRCTKLFFYLFIYSFIYFFFLVLLCLIVTLPNLIMEHFFLSNQGPYFMKSSSTPDPICVFILGMEVHPEEMLPKQKRLNAPLHRTIDNLVCVWGESFFSFLFFGSLPNLIKGLCSLSN